MHMHRRSIMSYNMVTEIKKKLTHSKIGIQIAFHEDKTAKLTFYLSIPRVRKEPSPILRPNPISIWWLAAEVICSGKTLLVQ